MKLKRQTELQTRISKYELGDFCYQYGFELIIGPSQANKTSRKPIRKYRSTRTKNFDPPKYYKRRYHKKPRQNYKHKPSSLKRRTDQNIECYKYKEKGHYANIAQKRKEVKKEKRRNKGSFDS